MYAGNELCPGGWMASASTCPQTVPVRSGDKSFHVPNQRCAVSRLGTRNGICDLNLHVWHNQDSKFREADESSTWGVRGSGAGGEWSPTTMPAKASVHDCTSIYMFNTAALHVHVRDFTPCTAQPCIAVPTYERRSNSISRPLLWPTWRLLPITQACPTMLQASA